MKVHQIVLDSNVEEGDPKLTALRLSSFGATHWEPSNFQHYTYVADVDATDTEEAFQLMNLWDQPERVQRRAPMHSLSVGDLLETEAGEVFMVDPCGFTRVSTATEPETTTLEDGTESFL